MLPLIIQLVSESCFKCFHQSDRTETHVVVFIAHMQASFHCVEV